MPRGYIPVTNNQTGETFKIPWDNPNTRPSPAELEGMIYDIQNEGLWSKASKPLYRGVSRTIRKNITDPIRKFSEGGDLDLGGSLGALQDLSGKLGLDKSRYNIPSNRKLAGYAAPAMDYLGEMIDQSTSPIGLAATLAGPAGKLGQIAGGASLLGRAGTALTYVPKGIGLGMMAHGGAGLYQGYQEPSGSVVGDFLNPALELGFGALGAAAPRFGQGIGKGAKPTPAASNLTTRGLSVSDWIEPGTPSPPSGPRGTVSSGILPTPRQAPIRPSIADLVDDPMAGNYPPRPEPMGSSSVELPRWGQAEAPPVRGSGRLPLMGEALEQTGVYNEAPYITQIRETFKKAVPPKGLPNESIPSHLQPESLPTLPNRIAQQTRQADELRLWQDIEAENIAAGHPPSKTGPPKPSALDPDPYTIRVENLRDPLSPNRANYGKRFLNELDAETFTNPEAQTGLSRKALTELERRVNKSAALRKLVDEGAEAPPTQTSTPTTKPTVTESTPSIANLDPNDRGLMAYALRAAEKVKQNPTLKRLAGQKGELNIDAEGLRETLSKFGSRAATKAGQLRSKALENIASAENTGVFGKARSAAEALTGPDVTGMSLGGAVKQGWTYIEQAGPAGKQLSRLLKRARQDVRAEVAEAEAKGTHLLSEKGTPINRVGGLIWERHGDEIKRLINEIEDPEKQKQVEEIVKIWTGQVKRNTAFDKGPVNIRNVQGLAKLSQFSIANPAGVVPAFLRGKPSSVIKNVKRVLPKGLGGDFAQASAEAAPSGSLIKGAGSYLDELGQPTKVSELADKLYRISGSEARMRTMATLVGRDTADDLFAKLKANPTSKKLRNQLDDLILEDVDDVLKQNNLTESQLRRAGGRMDELTQGLAESIDLPPHWTGNAVVDLMTQFKKYAYVQTKNMKDFALYRDPIKSAAVLATVAPAVGEAIGDVKASIRGAVKAGMKQEDLVDSIVSEIKKRGTGGGRYTENLGQAWALGLFGDALKAAERGTGGIAETIAGPTVGDIGEFSTGVVELLTKGQDYRLKRQVARLIPFIGTGVAANIKGSYAGPQKKRAKTKRTRRD